MRTIEEVERRRRGVAEQMLAIRSMERGSVASQVMPRRRRGEKEAVLRGPYYVLARWEKGKTVSRRLRTREAVEEARKDTQSYRQFTRLCEEFEGLTRELGQLERGLPEGQESKKNSRSRWSRTKR